jgi:hypothetical protein
MAVELTPTTYQRGVLIQSFNIYIMDLVHKDIRDRQDVLSDTQLTCLDIIALLDRDTRYDWHINRDNIVFTDFVDRFDQEVSGHWFKLDFRTPYPLDKCQVPLTSPVSVLLPTELQAGIDETAYIITVQIDSNGDEFTFAVKNDAYINAIFDWGDGNVSVVTDPADPDLNHVYTTAGTYTVKIWGANEHIRFNASEDVSKLRNLTQWGTGKFVSLESSYRDATNLNITASDTPNISTVTDISFAFKDNENNTVDFSNWSVQNVTNVSNTWRGYTGSNPDITGINWQAAQIQIWSNAFLNSSFNRDLTSLDFTAVTTMDQCFDGSDLSTDNYDKLLLALDRDGLSNCTIGAANTNYTIAVSGTARTNLTGRGCTITDAGGI